MTQPPKQVWRRWIRRVDIAAAPATSEKVCAHLSRWLDTHDGLVLSYRSMPGEVDLDALLRRDDAERFHLTRTPPSGPLTVHRASSPSERHRYGFDQPVAGSPMVEASEMAIVLVPGMAFGFDGSRLGHGAGYYDRLLPEVGAEAHLVGVAWSGIVVAAVPTEPHDVAMTHVVTEHGLRLAT